MGSRAPTHFQLPGNTGLHYLEILHPLLPCWHLHICQLLPMAADCIYFSKDGRLAEAMMLSPGRGTTSSQDGGRGSCRGSYPYFPREPGVRSAWNHPDLSLQSVLGSFRLKASQKMSCGGIVRWHLKQSRKPGGNRPFYLNTSKDHLQCFAGHKSKECELGTPHAD